MADGVSGSDDIDDGSGGWQMATTMVMVLVTMVMVVVVDGRW